MKTEIISQTVEDKQIIEGQQHGEQFRQLMPRIRSIPHLSQDQIQRLTSVTAIIDHHLTNNGRQPNWIGLGTEVSLIVADLEQSLQFFQPLDDVAFLDLSRLTPIEQLQVFRELKKRCSFLILRSLVEELSLAQDLLLNIPANRAQFPRRFSGETIARRPPSRALTLISAELERVDQLARGIADLPLTQETLAELVREFVETS